VATIAYDLSRFALIKLTGIAFWPFDIFGVFGRALFGAGNTAGWVPVAGALYHVTNGIGFAIAYTLILGERGTWAGIAWGLGLEAMMLTLYPGWLDLLDGAARYLGEVMRRQVGHGTWCLTTRSSSTAAS